MTLSELTTLAGERLEKLFALYLQNQDPPSPKLQEAMAYAVQNGGKRIRPILVYATGYALDASFENCDPAACAVELVHAYSLIHDDLPAMDNADLRRGKPSCHIAFGETTAILAGDALQPLAFEVLASHPTKLSAEQRLLMIRVLSRASGLNGMAAGQALDMSGSHSIDALTTMYRLKTGALLSASVSLGILASPPQTNETQNFLKKFGDTMGFAFQLQDDLLDFESETGKTQGLDVINGKKTYAALAGLEKTRETIDRLFSDALGYLEFLGEKADPLRDLMRSLLERKK